VELLNPHHLRYLLTDPAQDRNDLTVFFDALARIDPLERRWMLGFVNPAIGTDTVPDGVSEEDAADAELTLLKARCTRLLDSGIADFFLAYSMIAYICNHLRSHGDADVARANVQWLQGAVEFFQDRQGTAEPSADSAARASRRAEEAINNQRADTELFRERYNLFCDTVVSAMLPPAAQG
jgi:hypothetical protein